MSAPEKVRLKRKRNDEPPQSLILTKKHATTEKVQQLQYHRVRNLQDDNAVFAAAPEQASQRATTNATTTVTTNTTTTTQQRLRRIFHLKGVRVDGSTRLPTVEERRVPDRKPTEQSLNNSAASPRKRPGKGSLITQSSTAHAQQTQDPVVLETLAAQMHEFALEELGRSKTAASATARPKPKMSSASARARHERRIAAEAERADVEMEDGGEFVYDTYVLAAGGEDVLSAGVESGEVGVLVLSDEDEELLGAYLDGGRVESEDGSDEDDENAEDHYAADYPEDELDSDDEYGVGAYGYRARAGSDDEQWDEDTGAYSGDEDERDAIDGFGRKSAIPARWQKYIKGEGNEDD